MLDVAGKRVVFGVASGIGNAVFCLPTIKVLWQRGAHVILYIDADYQPLDLFARCQYASTVISPADKSAVTVPPADVYLSGHWCPPALRSLPGLQWARWTNEPHYHCAEWELAAQLVGGAERDVSDWCLDLDRSPRWDVGIVPGCKPGTVWQRKRYPYMMDVATALRDRGLSVAVFGLPADCDRVVGGVENLLGRYAVDELPDVLAGCGVVIGTDSGPTHLAASLGVPTVILYTATSPIKGDPVGCNVAKLHVDGLDCWPCQATSRWPACNDWRCQEILPATVVRTAADFLREGLVLHEYAIGAD